MSPGNVRPNRTNCPACGHSTIDAARFCHQCGEALTDAKRTTAWRSGRRFLLGIAAASVVLAGAALFALSTQESAQDAAPATRVAGARPPDLSGISPRDAADRLFNRIMAASERGDEADAKQFVPMAIEAYGLLPSLDQDAHYHLGLINLVAGDQAAVLQHITAMRDRMPDHLLALALEYKLAVTLKNGEGAPELLAAFSAAHDRELAEARPEYQAHGNIIREHRQLASQQAGATGAVAAAPASSVQDQEIKGSVVVKRPADLSEAARAGERLFTDKCAACHGPAGSGTDQGPPLIHNVYQPGHHADMAFVLAARHGVRAHHWKFGNMPPVPGVSDADIENIVAYVRAVQRANGIE